MCAQHGRPEGVARSLQVPTHKVEPPVLKSRCNLLTKDDCRAALADEGEPDRPKMSRVSRSETFSRRAERLARAGAGPDGPLVGPPGEPEGVGPPADAGEKVALSIPGKVGWNHIPDVPLVHVPGRDQPGLDQFSEPRRRVGVELGVVRAPHSHAATAFHAQHPAT